MDIYAKTKYSNAVDEAQRKAEAAEAACRRALQMAQSVSGTLGSDEIEECKADMGEAWRKINRCIKSMHSGHMIREE